MDQKLTIALAGNPNSGKTTLFNALTGSRQHVANYPGVTVEIKNGLCRYGEHKIKVVDLPGTYPLTAYSPEELVARQFILEQKPDVVVDVIDSSNLERNLYLAVQLMEMNVPLVLAFNMADVAKARGLEFDLNLLQLLLAVPIVSIVARKEQGIEPLLDVALKAARTCGTRQIQIPFGQQVESQLEKLAPLVNPQSDYARRFGARWVALKMLEGDRQILALPHNSQLLTGVELAIKELERHYHESLDIVIADRRYGFISGACQETVRTTVQVRHDMSDMIDRVLTHHLWGLPIFAVMMYVIFYLTFTVGAYPMGWLELLFGWMGSVMTAHWPAVWPEDVRSLLVDGVIGGVGGVIVFLPNILLLFLGIAFLEDTGYMARAAFLMDRIMHKIGLHGKSFIPMLVGFGCSVPAIMATRILENRRNRLTTMMVIPLMSCGARIPIYALIIPAFFAPVWQGPMMWMIYVIGIALAIVCAKLLRVTVFRGETAPFVMELPPYRMPTVKSLMLHMWDRGLMYLHKAGTVILFFSILLWAAGTYPKAPAEKLIKLDASQRKSVQLQYSITGRVGKMMAPAIKPLGFDWKIGTALIGAFAAKEVFVSQMGIVYSVANAGQRSESLRKHLREDYSPLVGFCIMLFCLIGTPCVATVAITAREAGGWKWAAMQYFGLTALAYILTLIVYQAGRLVV
ncbi:MAG: ferrous iron transport protein B [Planctomycetes bacterium]|nr:ferrous iron transport protein B [Planctomycetota bacterium]